MVDVVGGRYYPQAALSQLPLTSMPECIESCTDPEYFEACSMLCTSNLVGKSLLKMLILSN